MDDVGSKHIDGIPDLVVVAPIKPGFIKAFETISYASRVDVTANALNKLRVAAREYERVVPFSDVTERILGLFDFRVGVLDRDLSAVAAGPGGALGVTPQRYLYLTATFEGGFEPYMRQIWRPLRRRGISLTSRPFSRMVVTWMFWRRSVATAASRLSAISTPSWKLSVARGL